MDLEGLSKKKHQRELDVGNKISNNVIHEGFDFFFGCSQPCVLHNSISNEM